MPPALRDTVWFDYAQTWPAAPANTTKDRYSIKVVSSAPSLATNTAISSASSLLQALRDQMRQHQTPNAQFRVGEFRDSRMCNCTAEFDAEPVIVPRSARTLGFAPE
jgi:hypothetical protein